MLLAAVCVTALRAEAQLLNFSVASSVSSVQVSNVVAFSINVTNLIGLDLGGVVVTNQLPASVQIVNTSASQGTNLINGSVVEFHLGDFTNNAIAFLTVNARPISAGFITNTVSIASSTTVLTGAPVSIVIQATNAGVVRADLGVHIFGPTQVVITNDLTTYQVVATNSGPGTVTGVTLTNTLPPGAMLISAVPANYTLSQSNLIYNLGTLTNGGHVDLQFTIQPTNVGALLLSATIGSAAVIDLNPTNNIATTNVPVIAYLSGILVAVTNSSQQYNPQNGLIEQTILLSNAGPTSIASARVVVTGLTNLLANGVGTNSGNPYVYLCNTLDPNQSVSMLLQYYRPTRTTFPFLNSQLHAFEVPPVVFAAPTVVSVSTNLIISRILHLPNGTILLEWPAITNKTYTVVYCDNVLFSNAMIAPPSITAFGTRLQWVDYGPPTTRSAPTHSPVRFYRVFQNP